MTSSDSAHASAVPQPSARPNAPAAADHLIVPFAVLAADEGASPPSATPASTAHLPTPASVPNLHALLQRATSVQHHSCTAWSLTPPHEWALAVAQGRQPASTGPLPTDTGLPWAAWAHADLLPTPDTPAAWITPCHQEVGMDRVTLHPPAGLNLSDAHSRALMAALAPLAAEDGLTLTWLAADRWLATGEPLAGLHLASLDRVAGRHIGPWLPTHASAAALRRLMAEAQMLFYTHPAHDERSAQGLAPVNAIWISDCGAATATPASLPRVTVDDRLRTPALTGHLTAWAQAWAQLDAEVLADWLRRHRAGEALAISLCGEAGWVTLDVSTPPPVTRRISNFFKPHRLNDVLSKL